MINSIVNKNVSILRPFKERRDSNDYRIGWRLLNGYRVVGYRTRSGFKRRFGMTSKGCSR